MGSSTFDGGGATLSRNSTAVSRGSAGGVELFEVEMNVARKEGDEKKGKGRVTHDLVKVLVTFCLGLSFAGGVYLVDGNSERCLEYLTGYVVELSLSVDNLFVFLLIFNFFQVPREAQEPVLFWGILGAMVFRACMIIIGERLTSRFMIAQLAFAGVLIYSSVKLLIDGDDDEEDLSNNKIIRFARSLVNVSDRYNGKKFYYVEGGRRTWTPLLVVLISIELSDVVFAFDSVPAVLGISKDLFVIYTSNVFAILGLRSLYFVIADAIGSLRFLKHSLSVVLGFIGLKMVFGVFGVQMSTIMSLQIVVGTLTAGVVLSYVFPSGADSSDEKDRETV